MNAVEKARVLKNEGKIDEAIALLENFVKENKKERIGAHKLLSDLYLKKGENEKAIETLQSALKHNPDNKWLYLMLGDLFYFDLKDSENAKKVYKEGLSTFAHPVKTTMSPYRYFLKRLTTIFYDEDNLQEAEKYYELFIALEPSDFYASDFLKYADVLLKLGEKDKAKEILTLGIKTHPGYKKLYDFAKANFPEEEFPYREKKARANKYPDVKKIPIKTPLIREGDDLYAIVDKYTKDIRKPGDIITVSSCVAAMCEERSVTVDTIFPSKLAKFLSRFVSHKDVPFGGAAPLVNPAAMEIAIRESGVFRIMLAAIAGAVGKILHKSGWFYTVAGAQAALIDDPPAAIPPFDYAVIPGPKDSFAVSEKIKEITGCEAAIIDANDIGNAWAVGYSSGVNKKLLEDVLSDNPAGNEDQQTPIVIVRNLKG